MNFIFEVLNKYRDKLILKQNYWEGFFNLPIPLYKFLVLILIRGLYTLLFGSKVVGEIEKPYILFYS